MNDLETWLKEARARCEAATPGPWETEESYQVECDYWKEGDGRYTQVGTISGCDGCVITKKDADVVFTAHARTDLPRALDTIVALRAQLAEALEHIEKLRDGLPNCSEYGDCYRCAYDADLDEFVKRVGGK